MDLYFLILCLNISSNLFLLYFTKASLWNIVKLFKKKDNITKVLENMPLRLKKNLTKNIKKGNGDLFLFVCDKFWKSYAIKQFIATFLSLTILFLSSNPVLLSHVGNLLFSFDATGSNIILLPWALVKQVLEYLFTLFHLLIISNKLI